MDKVAELGISFRLVPVRTSQPVATRFELFVEANVIGTDDVVLERRNSWTVGFLHRTKSGVFLHLKPDAPRHKRVRVYTEYRSKAARQAIKKIEERISSLIAPKHLWEIRNLEAAIEMFEEVHKQLTVYTVMET